MGTKVPDAELRRLLRASAEQAGWSGEAAIGAGGFQHYQTNLHYRDRANYLLQSPKTTILIDVNLSTQRFSLMKRTISEPRWSALGFDFRSLATEIGTVSNVFSPEIKRLTSSFSNTSSNVEPSTAESWLQVFAVWWNQC